MWEMEASELISFLADDELAVSGQNKIGRELTQLALIQPTGDKQNAVNNNWLLRLQPAVMLQMDKNPTLIE